MTADSIPADDRHISAFSRREKVARLLWAMVEGSLFRYSFHSWYRWRMRLLRGFGARLHPTVRIRRSVHVECPWNLRMGRNSCLGDRVIAYCFGPIRIGDRVSVSQYAHLCAGSHDYHRPDLPLLRPPIDIADDVWIAADAFVGPGVRIGPGAVLGARGCAFKDLAPWTVYGGNPARPLKERPVLASVEDSDGTPAAPGSRPS